MRLQLNGKKEATQYLNITIHSGKMQGIPSISTSKYMNSNCLKMSQSNNDNCICKYCYVDSVANRYGNLKEALKHNTELLTNQLLTQSQLENNWQIIASRRRQ